MGEDNRDAAERYFRAFGRWDLETVASVVAEDAVEGRPQSGERFLGHERPVHLIGVAEFESGRMVKADYYFAYPFEPADWREPFAEQSAP